jgi:2-oxoglutarate dehydrogenase E2 component (dihydrolipoamide succinyltransferase)
MSLDLTIPALGESVTEVEIGTWLKKPGDTVKKDEPLVTLDSDKATVDLPAPESGTLSRILKQEGQPAHVGEVIAQLDPSPGAQNPVEPAVPTPSPQPSEPAPARKSQAQKPKIRAPAEPAAQRPETPVDQPPPRPKIISPPAPEPTEPPLKPAAQPMTTMASTAPASSTPGREEETVPMSRLRRTVAERLVQAQHNAALLTTFNEIDMQSVQDLRAEFGELFQNKYQVKLGFMSFFVKAAIDALKQFPVLNAELRGGAIVYHNYFDIGIAVGGGKGLVVPVLRNAERMSFAEIEQAVGDFGRRAKESKLLPDELQGGTFTISNGGVFGSLLSTPILNPPQSGVLGLHAIQQRPVARNDAVVIRPMMYVALTYDHRLVDGREAVTFLKRIKEAIETPARMLLET